ncbi:MAG: ATP-dependent RNA helicase RhlE [Parcubacteria group bacterium Greene0714_21]|nr:MAG: ATP-dependent RNA helicase RhlE [Parcubacteria group bacterium Greene1014_47]TSD04445.1 MAG: ATP-dependent RNA helicase RhlE [Parcubacteria group bacterium Greene0714_21]
MIQQAKTIQVHSPELQRGFSGLGIAPKLLEILAWLKFTTPTPIQYKAIPVAVEGKDVIGIAQTGTGKTLAFGVPLIQRIMQTKEGMGLIILPTRELALQVNEMLLKVGRTLPIRTAVLIGGASISYQIQALRRNPHIIIGTPGRIIDHLNQRTLDFRKVIILILDEADRMFDMGFAPQITKILQAVPKERQTMLFSATMPDNIMRIATSHMKLPVRVEIARSGTTVDKVEHELFVVRKDQKNPLLDKLLNSYKGSVLLFSRTKFGAKRICRDIKNMGHSVAEIHSNRSLAQRREALEGFKIGKYRVLVATDIASRGIDVKGIELVLNYDLPESPEDYVHRIGRTARAGREGRAISFVMPEQRHKVRDIERLTRIVLPVSQLPELPRARLFTPEPFGSEPQGRRPQSRRPAPSFVRKTYQRPRWK